MKKTYVIHGWTYTTKAWDACFAELKNLGVEPTMLHVPGLTEASDKVWTLDAYVDWLADKLKDEWGVNLVVHSNGGRIATEYMSRYPGKVGKLVLIDSAGLVPRHIPIRIKRFVFGGIAKAAKKIIDVDFARKIFYKLIRAKDYERAPKNMRETMKNLIVIDLREKLKTIKIPTLIIWGKKDGETPVGDAYVMHKAIEGSRLEVIGAARHSPHMTHPQDTAKLIADFL